MVQGKGGDEHGVPADVPALPLTALDTELAWLETSINALDPAVVAAVCLIVPRAQALGVPVVLGRALCLQAQVLAVNGSYAAAMPYADAAIAAFAKLDATAAQTYAGFVAEAWRVAGMTRMRLAQNTKALRLIEQAVLIAEDGARFRPEPHFEGTPICASTALIRARSTLGSLLITARNLQGALDALDGAVAAIDAAPLKAALVKDEVLLVFANIAEALHRLVREEWAADEQDNAAEHLEAARIILESRLKPLVLPEPALATGVEGHGRTLGVYWNQKGENLLLAGNPAEALNCFFDCQRALPAAGRSGLELGTAYTGLAQAYLALGQKDQALSHARLAVEEIGQEDAYYRSAALLVLSDAYRAIGDFRQALEAFTLFNKLRNQLEAASAQRYAAHVTARMGLERAQVEAEVERKNAATLEVLGQVGQQITAHLQAEAIFETLYRCVGNLLDAPAFVIWVLDSSNGVLRMAFGREDGNLLTDSDLQLTDPSSRAAWAVREGREILDENWDDLEGQSVIPGTRQMHTTLFAPLVAGNRCLGVLSVQSDRRNAYDETARWILRTLCAYGAIALDNAAAHRELSETLSQLHNSQAQLARRTEELERLSTIDPLTGAGNRRFLESKALAEIAAARRHGRPLGIALFDIDYFKTINDQHGHATGDDVLKDIVGVTRRMLRPNDFLARLGGEEFALLLPASDRLETMAIAERIRNAISATPFGAETTSFTITASFGVSELKAGDQNLSASLNRADKALYRAKQEGRNRVVAAETQETA